MLGIAGITVLSLAGLVACGRTGPVDALPEGNGDPDIAGVSVTSPDAVVEVDPTLATEEPLATSTSPAETVVESPAQATYEVKSGDTLSGIATTFGITIADLADANGLSDVDSISPGQVLLIPTKPVEVSVVDANQTSTTITPSTQPAVTQPQDSTSQP
ncbi:MAG: LysM peptidoglycan-binding domain-containing protein [Acidimicrobiales bacterium]